MVKAKTRRQSATMMDLFMMIEGGCDNEMTRVFCCCDPPKQKKTACFGESASRCDVALLLIGRLNESMSRKFCGCKMGEGGRSSCSSQNFQVVFLLEILEVCEKLKSLLTVNFRSCSTVYVFALLGS